MFATVEQLNELRTELKAEIEVVRAEVAANHVEAVANHNECMTKIVETNKNTSELRDLILKVIDTLGGSDKK